MMSSPVCLMVVVSHDARWLQETVQGLNALAAQHEITRAEYREAQKGIAFLAPQSRPCVTTAFTLYKDILDRIEEIDFAVFSQRATVGKGRRLQVFVGGLVRARRARRTRAA